MLSLSLSNAESACGVCGIKCCTCMHAKKGSIARSSLCSFVVVAGAGTQQLPDRDCSFSFSISFPMWMLS